MNLVNNLFSFVNSSIVEGEYRGWKLFPHHSKEVEPCYSGAMTEMSSYGENKKAGKWN